MSFIINLTILGLVVLVDLILKIISSPLWLIVIIPVFIWFNFMAYRYGGSHEQNGVWYDRNGNEIK